MKKNEMSQISYIELPLKVFAERFPQLYAMLPPVFDINDNEYIVRLKEGRIEVGYASDDWVTE